MAKIDECFFKQLSSYTVETESNTSERAERVLVALYIHDCLSRLKYGIRIGPEYISLNNPDLDHETIPRYEFLSKAARAVGVDEIASKDSKYIKALAKQLKHQIEMNKFSVPDGTR